MVEGLGNLSYLSLHLFVIGVSAIKRGMSEGVPGLVSASLSTSESIKNEVNTSRPSANAVDLLPALACVVIHVSVLLCFRICIFYVPDALYA